MMQKPLSLNRMRTVLSMHALEASQLELQANIDQSDCAG